MGDEEAPYGTFLGYEHEGVGFYVLYKQPYSKYGGQLSMTFYFRKGPFWQVDPRGVCDWDATPHASLEDSYLCLTVKPGSANQQPEEQSHTVGTAGWQWD